MEARRTNATTAGSRLVRSASEPPQAADARGSKMRMICGEMRLIRQMVAMPRPIPRPTSHNKSHVRNSCWLCERTGNPGWVQGLSRGPRAVLKFHLCVRRSGVLGCRNENFACVLLCVFVSLDGCEVDRRRDPCAFYVPLCACVSRVCPVCVSRLPPVSFYRYRMANNELARLGDAGVGVSCRHAPHASGPHHTSRTVAGGTGKHCLLISLIHLIASSVSSQTFHSRFPSHLPLLRSPVHAVLLVVLVGLVALSSTAVTREAQIKHQWHRWYFQLPALHPILIISLCTSVAGPL